MPDYDLGTAKGRIEIDASGATREINQAASAQRDFVKGAGQGLPGDNALAQAGKQAKYTDAQLQEAGGTLQKTGVQMAAVGVGLLGALGVAIKSSADFEKTISGIGAVSGATEKQLDQLREKGLQLGADTAFSAGEAAMAMQELSKAGLSVEEILNGAADATVNLAAAGEIALPEAAAIASAAMNQFKLSAEELPKVADLIAGAANASAIDVNDFGQSMNQAGVVASTVGLSFDDLALAITAMGKQGFKGSDAGTSLKTMLLNLQPQTKKQIGLFDELGLTVKANATEANTLGNAFFDGTGKIKSMAEIAGVMETALAGMSEQQKLSTLEMLFGSDAIRAAALISSTGAKGMDDLSTSMGKITAADVAAKRMDNLSGAIEQFKGSVETVLIKAGAPFQDVLKTIVDFATKLINLFGDLPAPIQQAITWVVAIGGALFLAAGSGAFILGTFLKFGIALKEFKAALLVAKNVGVLSKAMGLLNLSFLTNPIFLVIAALVALGFGLYKLYQNSEAFRNFIDGLWQGIQRLWDKFLDFAKSIPEMFGKALDWLKKNWTTVLAVLTGPIGLAVLWISRNVDKIVGFFKDLPKNVLKALGKLWDGVLNLFKEFPGNVIGILKSGAKKLLGIFSDDIPDGVDKGTKKTKKSSDKLAKVFSDEVPDAIKKSSAKTKEAVKQWSDSLLIEDKNMFYETVNRGLDQVGKGDGLSLFSKDGAIANLNKLDFDRMMKEVIGGGEYGKYSAANVGVDIGTSLGFMEDDPRTIQIINQMIDLQRAHKSAAASISEQSKQVAADSNSNWGKAKESVGAFYTALAGNEKKPVLSGVAQNASKDGATLRGTFVSVVGAAQSMWDGITGGSETAKTNSTNALAGIGQAAKDALGPEGETAKAASPGALEETFGGIALFFSGLPDKIGQSLSNLPAAFSYAFSVLPGVIGTELGRGLGLIVRFGADTAVAAGISGYNFITGIGNWFAQLPGQIMNFLNIAYSFVTLWAGNLWNKAVETGLRFVSGLTSNVSTLPQTILGILSRATSFVQTWGGTIWTTAKTIGKNILDGIVGTITDIPTKITGILFRAIDAFKSLVSRAFNAAKDFASGLWNGFKEGLGIKSPSYIEKAMFAMNDNVNAEMKTLAKNVSGIQSIGNNIPDVQASVRLAVAAEAPVVPPSAEVLARAAQAQAQPNAVGLAGLTVQGPLVSVEGGMSVRNDSDILDISRSLADLVSAEQLAQGKKVGTNAGR